MCWAGNGSHASAWKGCGIIYRGYGKDLSPIDAAYELPGP
ncbi:hypothetical protein HMPREF9946_02529 [Acetobacteraceae bacterium AT-5844]|nr:hypothetical protein HMPREF9946_02529 [Acetobacteraceae bacterium AT-5844]